MRWVEDKLIFFGVLFALPVPVGNLVGQEGADVESGEGKRFRYTGPEYVWSEEVVTDDHNGPIPPFANPFEDETIGDPVAILEQYGVAFSEGTGARYDVGHEEATGALLVENTPYQHLLVGAVMRWMREQERMEEVATIRARRSNEKLFAKIVFPEVKFEGLPLGEALDFLREEGGRIAPKDGSAAPKIVPFRIETNPAAGGIGDEVDPADRRITLHLEDVSLFKAVQYSAALASMGFRVGADEAVLYPPHLTPNLRTRVYSFPPYLFDYVARSDEPVKGFLGRAGLTFPLGTAAILSLGTRQLIIRNSEEDLNKLEDLLLESPEEWKALVPEERTRSAEEILRETVLPRVEFEEFPLGAAIAFLNTGAFLNYGDPFEEGYAANLFFISTEAITKDVQRVPITMKAKDITIEKALEEVCGQAGCDFEVMEYGVLVRNRE